MDRIDCTEDRTSRPARTRTTGSAGFSLIELMAALGVLVVVTAMVIPLTQRTIGSLSLQGDARGVASYVALAKMRAAADFTHARVFVDLNDNTYHLETWQKTGTPGWVTQGGIQTLSRGVTFSVAGLTTPPPNTQTTLAQAPPCLDDTGNVIGDTACVVFDSRGTPIDTTGAPIGIDALYVTDGTAVYGTTVSATGMSRFWWSPATAPAWANQ
ncbi:MAG TPA: prepilin-type N-terminal cleavage/methylation domain-containing protein [Vicinamibacterales bacterium]|nr:prepilin-type N-terminal cleavage/methylation domain-containing protein [Vicinamibacterales bacterium]